MKILIADDQKDIRLLFKTFLRCGFLGSEIDVVVNGAEAVSAFRDENYDVLLMDLRMPVKDGYQACLEIQEICRKENLKMPFIIICTGFTASKEVENLLADKTHYALLHKPVSCEQIIDTIKTIMNPSKSSTEIALGKSINLNDPKTVQSLKKVFRG